MKEATVYSEDNVGITEPYDHIKIYGGMIWFFMKNGCATAYSIKAISAVKFTDLDYYFFCNNVIGKGE